MDIKNVDYEKFSKKVIDDSKYIYENFRKNKKNSNNEIEIIKYIEDSIKNKNVEIEKQDFEATKKSHLWIYATSISFILALASYFYLPILSPIFICIALIPFIFNFLLSINLFDFLFYKVKSQNLIAKLKPKENIKKRIILTTHIDSTKVKPFNTISLKLRLTVASFLILFCVYLIILSIISMLYTKVLFRPLYFDIENEKLFILIGFSLFFFLPFVISIFFIIGLNNSPSINTSLTSALIIKEILNEMKIKKLVPNNTEIQFLIAGSSEDNLQGIKNLFKNDKNYAKDVQTIAITIEALFERSNITANISELRLIPKNSQDIINIFKDSTEKLNININNNTYFYRNTESKIFNKNNIPSASITAEPINGKLYASKMDKPSTIDSQCIIRVAKIILTMIDEYDKTDKTFKV